MKPTILRLTILAAVAMFSARHAPGQDTSACHQLGVDCSHPTPTIPPGPRPDWKREQERERRRQLDEAARRKMIGDETQQGLAALDRGDVRAAGYHCSKALELDPGNRQLQACKERAVAALRDQRSASTIAELGKEFDNQIKTAKSEAQAYNALDANTAQAISGLTSEFETFRSGLDTKLKIARILQGRASGQLSAGELVNILEHASERSWKPDENAPAKPLPKIGLHNAAGQRYRTGDPELSKNCSQYFREVMRGLAKSTEPRFDVKAEWIDRLEGCPADCFSKKIRVSNKARDGQWLNVAEAKVQGFADQGVLAIGISPGHIAVAFPNAAGARLTQGDTEGPLVRDGNEHPPKSQHDKRLYASSWGAVRASKAFDYGKHPPAWYVWVPSVASPADLADDRYPPGANH